MQMRSFTGRNVQDAMAQAREQLGEDAVILATDTGDDGGVIVTFALDRGDPIVFEDEPRPPADYFQHAAPFSPHLADILRHHGTPEPVVQKLLSNGDGRAVADLPGATKSMASLLSKACRFDPLPLNAPGFRLMLIGPPGVGKTIAAAKIAARIVVDNQPLRVISTDSHRAGGADQLAAFTRILGVELDLVSNRKELQRILSECSPDTRIVIDSAGCNPYDFQELKELGEMATLSDIEPVLVCAAGIDPAEAEEVAGVFSFLAINRVIISRTDCARRFGSALALAAAGGYAFAHFTSSARAMGDLLPLSASALAHLLTQYQRERIAA